MKTRTELILDFMLALSNNEVMTNRDVSDKIIARDIFLLSAELTEKYLDVVSGRF